MRRPPADAAILPTATDWIDNRDAKASLHPHALALSMAPLQLMNGSIVHKLRMRQRIGIKMEDMNDSVVHILQKVLAWRQKARL